MTQTQVLLAIEQDESGFPPFEREAVWAEPREEHRYEIVSVPCYARGYSLGDVLDVEEVGAALRAVRVAKRGGHSTVHVKVTRGPDARATVDWLVRGLTSLGCLVERTNLATLLAVDVPPEASLDLVVELLETSSAELWDFETSMVQH